MSTTNQNTNIPDWMYKTWHMATMNGSNLASNATFSVDFDTSDPSNITVKFQSQSTSAWGTLDTNSVTAAALSMNAVTSVTGTTSSGQPFHIYHTDTDTTLSCYLDEADYQRQFFSQRRWLAVGLGMTVGTLLGGAVGFAARSLLPGAVAGLTGATTALLVARGVEATTTPGTIDGGGSTPTWVANDPDGRVGGKPGPQAVPPVRATA